jgi:aspartate/methionine/tyrosine aminotransferase
LILNSPVNPSARVLSAAELEAVAALAARHNLWIVFDQVYSDLLHSGSFAGPQSMVPERTLVVDSLSKTFGMTGWRLGSLAMPAGSAKSFQRFMQHSAYCVPGFVQQAGVAAFGLFDEVVPQYRALFRARQVFAAERLSAVPGLACALPDAGFYLFPKVSGSDVAVSAHWLEQLGIASMPGSAFGPAGAGHIRLALTAPDADLHEAMDRITAWGQQHACAA